MSKNDGRSKKNKRPDNRPARKRYWDSGNLAYRKVRKLWLSGKFGSPTQALLHWESIRTRHKGSVPMGRIQSLAAKHPRKASE